MNAANTSVTEAGPFPEIMAERLAGIVGAAPGRPTRESFSPFDRRRLGEVPTCTAEDVSGAVMRSRTAQRMWSHRSVGERCQVMLDYHDLVLDRQAHVLDVIQAETGKARISAFEEVEDVAMTARYYGAAAPRYLKPERRHGAMPGLTQTTEHHHPKGIVGVISPWNYPFTLSVSDAIPALLAGNGIVLKPDAQAPFSALVAVALLQEAGLPPDLFQVVTGPGRVLGPPMIEHVDYVMFTGSVATGRMIAEQCGRRLVGFSAELGGKNPMVVLSDADVDKTVDGAVRACFSNSGQLCISIERMYIENSIYDRFVPAFVERVKAVRLGRSLTWDADMGCLISQEQLDAVASQVADAVSKGARVLAGGRARPDLGPLFYEPTVLECVTDDMVLARDETFGPVVSLYRVDDVEEAIERANDSCYGLNASVWSTPSHGAEVAVRIRAGTVNVNEGYAAAWASHDAPMGGMKDSGVGRRHGREGILKYTESQTVAVQRGIPIGPVARLPADKYARIMTAGLRALKKVPLRK